MKNDQSKRLIEHIGDQYVSLAADPVKAFDAIRERKARGRVKLWAATAACLVFSLLVAVVLLSGMLNQTASPVVPDDPTPPGNQPDTKEPETDDPGSDQPGTDDPGTDDPGTDEPGTEEPDDTQPTYPEPEITLPDLETFGYHIRGFWTSNWPEGWENINYLFNFQYNGQVYILNLSTKEAEIGRYSFADDQIELFTLTESVGWEKSDITMRLNRAEINSETNMTITDGEYTETYIRMQLNTTYLKICDLDTNPGVYVPVEAFSIEEMTLFEPYDPYTVSYELPSLKHVETLEVHQFSSAPDALRFSSIFSAEYKIYDKNLKLIAEGECATTPNSELPEIEFPEEDGLYYLEVIADDFQNTLFDSLILHFYAAIQVGEPEPDDPVTPPDEPGTDEPDDTQPTYPEPEITLPDPLMFVQHMQSYWTSADWGEMNYIFNFQLDGRVYIINLDTHTGEIGRYSMTNDDTIKLWTLTEGIGWETSDITLLLKQAVSPHQTALIVSKGDQTQTYVRIEPQDEHLTLRNYNITPSEAKAVYPYHIGQATCDSPTIIFDLPGVEYFKQIEVFQFTNFPDQLSFASVPSVQYKIYNRNLDLIIEGECITMRNFGECVMEVPKEDGLYYLEVIANPASSTSIFTMLFDSLEVHYYAAIQVGEPEAQGPSIPANSILSDLCTVWYLDIEDSSTHGSTYFIFTPTHQFYTIDTKTGESVQGVYTTEAHPLGQYKTNITLWVLDEEGEWQEYPLEMQMEGSGRGLDYYKLHVTGENGKISYSRNKVNVVDFLAGGKNAYGIFDHHASFSSYGAKYYVESIDVTMYNTDPHNQFEFEFDYDNPEIFNGMTPIPFGAGTDTIRPDNLGGIASYTIYRADGTIYKQGDFDFSDQYSYSLNGIELIPDGQVYYYHVRYLKNSLKSDGLQYVVHAYFAIQQAEKQVAPGYTPPQTPPDPEITLPDASYFQTYLRDVWYPSALDGYREVKIPLWFAFQQDGRVYIWNTKTNQSTIGRYSVTDDRINIYSCLDGISWKKENIDIQMDTDSGKLIVTYGNYTDTFNCMPSTYHHVTVLNNDTRTQEKAYVYNFYFEEFSYNGVTYRFELPRFEIFRQLTPLSFTDVPLFSMSSLACILSYQVYRPDGTLISEGTWSPMHDRIGIPDEYGIYYVDITCSTSYANTEQTVHYYIAIDYHAKPEDNYTPPVLGDNRVSIPLLDCDTPLDHMELDTQNALHGSGCASAEVSLGSPVVSPNQLSAPIDATGMDMLEFDLYVSDVSLLTGKFFSATAAALEITSGGTCDYEELTFTWEDIVRYGLAGQELKEGWNHVVFPLSMAQETGITEDKFDISQIDFIRFYIIDTTKLGNGSYTVKLDNICLTGEAK